MPITRLKFSKNWLNSKVKVTVSKMLGPLKSQHNCLKRQIYVIMSTCQIIMSTCLDKIVTTSSFISWFYSALMPLNAIYLSIRYLTSRHNDLTSRHNYLTSDGRILPPYLWCPIPTFFLPESYICTFEFNFWIYTLWPCTFWSKKSLNFPSGFLCHPVVTYKVHVCGIPKQSSGLLHEVVQHFLFHEKLAI